MFDFSNLIFCQADSAPCLLEPLPLLPLDVPLQDPLLVVEVREEVLVLLQRHLGRVHLSLLDRVTRGLGQALEKGKRRTEACW